MEDNILGDDILQEEVGDRHQEGDKHQVEVGNHYKADNQVAEEDNHHREAVGVDKVAVDNQVAEEGTVVGVNRVVEEDNHHREDNQVVVEGRVVEDNQVVVEGRVAGDNQGNQVQVGWGSQERGN